VLQELAKAIRVETKALVELVTAFESGGLSISASKLGYILDGRRAKKDPFTESIAGEMTRYVLLGATSKEFAAGTAIVTQVQAELADRIVTFFFPRAATTAGSFRYPETSGDFFDVAYRFASEPIRSAEAMSEIFALTTAVEPRLCVTSESAGTSSPGIGRIIRSSGSERFLQVRPEGKSLTRSGEATVEAIRNGVKVEMLFPRREAHEGPTEAESSARIFEAICATVCPPDDCSRLRLLPCDRSSLVGANKDWAGDFLSAILRFVYHEYEVNPQLNALLTQLSNAKLQTRSKARSAGKVETERPSLACETSWHHDHCEGANIWERPRAHKYLMVSRSPTHGPCAWGPDAKEVHRFERWAESFRSHVGYLAVARTETWILHSPASGQSRFIDGAIRSRAHIEIKEARNKSQSGLPTAVSQPAESRRGVGARACHAESCDSVSWLRGPT